MLVHEMPEGVYATSIVDSQPLYGRNCHIPGNVQIFDVGPIFVDHPYEVIDWIDQIYNLIVGSDV